MKTNNSAVYLVFQLFCPLHDNAEIKLFTLCFGLILLRQRKFMSQ